MKTVKVRELKNGDVFKDLHRDFPIWMAAIPDKRDKKTYSYVVLYSDFGGFGGDGLVHEWTAPESMEHEVVVLFNCINPIKQAVDRVRKDEKL